MAIVKQNWSGGKDSTAAFLLHLEQGDTVKAVCYIPMFTDDIPLILKSHYEFLQNAADRFRQMGASVDFVHGITYYDCFYHRSTRGKYKGRLFGFPMFWAGRCRFQSMSKKKALDSFDVGMFDYEDVSIAYDEPQRLHNINGIDKRSILTEKYITESAAKEMCITNDLLSPHYINAKRDGCALCPHMPKHIRDAWFAENPGAVEIVKEMQRVSRIERPGIYPLGGHKWFIEDEEAND